MARRLAQAVAHRLNQYQEWSNQRDDSFNEFIQLGDKHAASEATLFATDSMGVKSNRDDWVYNFSLDELRQTLKCAIRFYNSESKRIRENALGEDDLDRDKKKIKWTSDLSRQALMGTVHSFQTDAVRISLYRPFTKQWSYFDASWKRSLPPRTVATRHHC